MDSESKQRPVTDTVHISLDTRTLRRLIATRVLVVEDVRCEDSHSRACLRDILLQVVGGEN